MAEQADILEKETRALIADELVAKKKRTIAEIGDNYADLRQFLIFYAPVDKWNDELAKVIDIFGANLGKADKCEQKVILHELVCLVVDLSTMSTSWYLDDNLKVDNLQKGQSSAIEALKEEVKKASEAAEELHKEYVLKAKKRYLAEAVAEGDVDSLVENDMGFDLVEYVEKTIEISRGSNFAKIAKAMIAAPKKTVLGNDYGDFLQETLWLGASYVTTNPPLVNAAWAVDENYWNEKLKRVVETEQELLDEAPDWMSESEKLCSIATMLVVEGNCEKLRDIFLTTNGDTGYCCYQVNPYNASDPQKMTDEVRYIFNSLNKRLGGVPNVSFKLPGVPSAMETAKSVSKEGISLSITMEYGLFQALSFAEIFSKGTAITYNLVVMNGRVAFPVRDELRESGVENGDEASKLVGVEITRRLFKALYSSEADGGMALDPRKIRIMNASLRNYGDEIPDLTESWGSPLITIFPNARRVLDNVPREISTDSILGNTPKEVIDTLNKSDIFQQAYWFEGDKALGKPDFYLPFTKDYEEQILKWAPIEATWNQFKDAYTTLTETVSPLVKS